MKKTSKTQVRKQITGFFRHTENKNPKQVKKIKRLAMKHNIPLKEKRKLFCKKCLTPYKNPRIKIKNKMKRITCKKCSHISGWRLKKEEPNSS